MKKRLLIFHPTIAPYRIDFFNDLYRAFDTRVCLQYWNLRDQTFDYEKIYEGSWNSCAPYGVIHRIAVKYRGRGIADFCFSECIKIAGSIRIDTHVGNLPMRGMLEKNGFKYCGTIYLNDGQSRCAYEKCV